MSEERVPTISLSIRAKKEGTKTIKIRIFPARLWKSKAKSGRKNIHPGGYTSHSWWFKMYRVEVSGKWLKEEGKQYTFHTWPEVEGVILKHTNEAK